MIIFKLKEVQSKKLGLDRVGKIVDAVVELGGKERLQHLDFVYQYEFCSFDNLAGLTIGAVQFN